MNSNPYAPPVAAVQDMDDDDYQPVRVWSSRGRIGRLRFLANMMGAYLASIAAGFLVGIVASMSHTPKLISVVPAVVGVVYGVFFLLKAIQRSHDMDWSGWASLLTFVPLLNLVWIFKPGTRGSNRFGAPPPPNTVGVRVLGLWLPLIFVVVVIGVVAAISIPAYQQYSKTGASQRR